MVFRLVPLLAALLLITSPAHAIEDSATSNNETALPPRITFTDDCAIAHAVYPAFVTEVLRQRYTYSHSVLKTLRLAAHTATPESFFAALGAEKIPVDATFLPKITLQIRALYRAMLRCRA